MLNTTNMKIIDAKPTKSKSETFRAAIKQIAGKNKAAFLESESDFKLFCQLVRSLGLKPKSQKLKSGGWNVWIIN